MGSGEWAGLSHSLKAAHLQASWAKNQVIKKSDWTIIIAMSTLGEALPRACELELTNFPYLNFCNLSIVIHIISHKKPTPEPAIMSVGQWTPKYKRLIPIAAIKITVKL